MSAKFDEESHNGSVSIVFTRTRQISDIEQQPPFGDREKSNIQSQNRGGGLQNQQEHHIILTKYEGQSVTDTRTHARKDGRNHSSVTISPLQRVARG